MRTAPHARDTEFRIPLELAELQDGDVVLDFPSGGGYLRRLLADCGKTVTYLPAENVHAYREYGLDIIRCADWLHVPLANDSVDVVLTIAAIHHLVGQRPDFYREMHRLLRPGGRFVIADVAVATAPAQWLDGFVDKFSTEGHTASFLDECCEVKALAAAGFEQVSYRLSGYSWDFPDEQTAIDFCRGLFRLDRATDSQILEGLQNYLGMDASEPARIPWCLATINCRKPG